MVKCNQVNTYGRYLWAKFTRKEILMLLTCRMYSYKHEEHIATSGSVPTTVVTWSNEDTPRPSVLSIQVFFIANRSLTGGAIRLPLNQLSHCGTKWWAVLTNSRNISCESPITVQLTSCSVSGQPANANTLMNDYTYNYIDTWSFLSIAVLLPFCVPALTFLSLT